MLSIRDAMSTLALSPTWDFQAPHVLRVRVGAEAIDAFRHVNNAIYLQWLGLAAWSHSESRGVSASDCLKLNRGMVVHHAELDYLLSAIEGDELQIATWIVASDQRLRCTRSFQIMRIGDCGTLLRARIDYVCMNLQSGRATRMPSAFSAAYVAS